MEDVARLAGVSHQTVSRVLNMHPNVSARTRKRVERAIAELGYRRNTAARSLVTRRSQAIGVLAAGTAHYGPANTLLGVQHAARNEGYAVSMASLSEVTPAAIRAALEHFLLQSVDGIVVIVPHETMLASLRAITVSVPLVAVGFGADERLTVAAVNQRAGAALAVQHLVNLGHIAIAHISGPQDWMDAAARTEGWRRALEQAGLPEGVLIPGDWSAGSGYRAGLELSAVPNMTAVFAANDQMALGALRAFREAGLRVPEDISVVGFDDQPEAGYFVPPLTTVNQGFTELGARCISMLLSDLENGPSGAASVLNPRLVVRGSTAAPR
ncbi:LacI family DNA-binding transcriptional regulator [Arthrobacter sp. QXT-31]|uniref:LacI family DNA-binding transcriptional regulator n=1 Tax=Arthrobacter sp. QXT-31 TaxID=1357915 RepID=UPI000971858D|nr:LacI family DNA-binding transcriptional regulator [Arthrobacter sp. QXT-31]APX01857.1 LacI family transcriptional regulator [Arthrobacter sp. QXT-31]